MERYIHDMMCVRIIIAQLWCRKLYAWGNACRKKENAKVKNYDLRDLDNEMNIKEWKLENLINLVAIGHM